MHRLARDETAALTAVAVGLLLVGHRWVARMIRALVQAVDDALAEVE